MDKIVLKDKDNKEVEFNIIDTFGVDEKTYAALEPLDEDFIVIFEVIEEKDSVSFKFIENDKELDEIINIYEDMKED
ncbi:DUF1292 domain-containing protein [Anaerococcus sp. AGMB00486]|uniref:DUF1292 domain-containing protein n=1 Tax=Anaerococcus faecalis TaxID=2742993 RepID=A0ABX2N7F2_9FIRM|nr:MULTISPECIES: DUF1292 domain-containing protein [Anaerococcus]MDY3005478.1 DUF1292 domain-containing protein [Anaerococcus porci]NVF10610.1 DUF1292 domain-containing protein [Anaerococcus faecalis]